MRAFRTSLSSNRHTTTMQTNRYYVSEVEGGCTRAVVDFNGIDYGEAVRTMTG